MNEEEKRSVFVKVYLTTSQKDKWKNQANKLGKKTAEYVRDTIEDRIRGDLVLRSQLQELPGLEGFEQKFDGKMGDLMDLVNKMNEEYDMDWTAALDQIAQLDVFDDIDLEQKIMGYLKDRKVFLDQIASQFQVHPKIALKSLANLRRKQLVEQDLSMRWFIC